MSDCRQLKVVMLGDTAVGKTSLIQAFSGVYTGDTKTTLAPNLNHFTVTNNYNVAVGLNVWDTAGQDRYNSITDFYLRGANVALLCFPCAVKSFDEAGTLQKWLQRVNDNVPDCVVIFVGTKSDLVEPKVADEVRARANQVIEATRAYTYCETSAKTGAGVKELFGIVANQDSEVCQATKTLSLEKEPEKRQMCCK